MYFAENCWLQDYEITPCAKKDMIHLFR